jgi:hypothetical protein
MASGCRDCVRCTDSLFFRLLWWVPNLCYRLLFSWNYGIFKKHCPECGHFMSQHHRRPDGSFAD